MKRKQGTIRTACLTVMLVMLVGCVSALAKDDAPLPTAEIHTLMYKAKKLGAKSQLPLAWRALDERVKTADDTGADAVELADMKIAGQRLLNQATFVDQMRQRRSGLEAMLGRFDQALTEIAALYRLETDPVLAGTEAANALILQLNKANLKQQVKVDSLTVANRLLNSQVGGRMAEQDSLITALQLQVSSLRQQLWEMDLRAGVAEADRSAAESVLSRKQKREEAIAAVGSSFSAKEADILLTPNGDVLLRLFGLSFAVNSAELKAGQTGLMSKVADAIRSFPGAEIRVEGHTDDTGSRAANLRLSRRRAETVARKLETELELAEGTAKTVGVGPDKPIALNSTAEGRALNRRIELVLTLVD